jgi:hypothetical protein
VIINYFCLSKFFSRSVLRHQESKTIVSLKNGVFWVVTPCGSCKNRRFGGTWRLLHQGDKICELGTTQAAISNRRTPQEPHGVTTQKTPFFIVTAVKTSNLTSFITAYDFNNDSHSKYFNVFNDFNAASYVYKRHEVNSFLDSGAV